MPKPEPTISIKTPNLACVFSTHGSIKLCILLIIISLLDLWKF